MPEEYRRLDALVNNAAFGVAGTVEHTDTATWRQIMGVDVDGAFFASKAALPHLRRAGGCIVNVGSVSGLGADWGLAAYNTGKNSPLSVSAFPCGAPPNRTKSPTSSPSWPVTTPASSTAHIPVDGGLSASSGQPRMF